MIAEQKTIMQSDEAIRSAFPGDLYQSWGDVCRRLVGAGYGDVVTDSYLRHSPELARLASPQAAIALAAIDTALWDLRAKKQGLPLWKLAGGAKESCPLYTTEGGWLHIEPEALVEDALAAKAKGFNGSKVKIGKPHGSEDFARLSAVRKAVGDGYEIMTDCNQGFAVDEAIRRAERLRDLDLAWIEEPLAADDIDGHVRLNRSTATPVAVGESL